VCVAAKHSRVAVKLGIITMRFFTLAYKNVARRPFRSLLTVLGLSTAIAAVVALVGIANGFVRSFSDVYAEHGVDIVVSRKGAADRISSAMDQSYIEQFRNVEGIDDASGFLLETMSLEEIGAYGLPAMGVDPQSRMLDDYRILAGRSFQQGDKKVALLGNQLVPRLAEKVGEQIEFFEDEAFEVVGIFESSSAWENGSLILPVAELQRLTGRPDQVTFVNIVLAGTPTQQDVERVATQIEAIDNKLAALPTADFVKTDARMQIAGSMAWMTSSIALLIGAIGMLNTMMTSIFERTREIGILKAVGWTRSRIVRMVLMEATLLSLAASVVGIAMGIVGTWCLSYAPSVGGIIAPYFDTQVVIQGVLLAAVIGWVGAAYPAYRASQLLPTEALRQG
jgi:putative ABC transport system permease protein